LAHDTEAGGFFLTTAAPSGPAHPARYTPLAHAAAWLSGARANTPNRTMAPNATCFISNCLLLIPDTTVARVIFSLIVIEIIFGNAVPRLKYYREIKLFAY
jgi:hypothetical protein